jgi:transposase
VRPTHVDQTYLAPLPPACPHCHGALRRVRIATQYQEEVPVQRPVVRRFDVQIGRCTQCHRRVQGRHPLQTSDALGAAAVQLGPHAVAFAVLLNKRDGMPYGKIAALLRDRFDLTITRGRRGPRRPPRGAVGAADLCHLVCDGPRQSGRDRR